MNISKELIYWRQTHQLSQKQLSEAVQINANNISRWEAGIHMPRVEDCVKLARFYGITIDELIGVELL